MRSTPAEVLSALYYVVKWVIVRILALASSMDVLLKASRWFGWESVPHWPIVRFYDPERYAPYVGLRGGWSPLGSWHNFFVLGGFGFLMFAFAMLVQYSVLRALRKEGLTFAEEGLCSPVTLARIRPIALPYFTWLFVASVGSIVALCSPEIFQNREAVAPALKLALGACLATVAVAEGTFILTGDLETLAEEAAVPNPLAS